MITITTRNEEIKDMGGKILNENGFEGEIRGALLLTQEMSYR